MGIYRLTVKTYFPIGSGGGTNTWHIRSTPGPALPVPSIITAISTFYNAIKGLFPSDMGFTYDGNLAQVDSTSPPLLGGFTPFAIGGSATSGNYGPAGVGACVIWRSGVATRSG